MICLDLGYCVCCLETHLSNILAHDVGSSSSPARIQVIFQFHSSTAFVWFQLTSPTMLDL
jgi:hypothetical protein